MYSDEAMRKLRQQVQGEDLLAEVLHAQVPEPGSAEDVQEKGEKAMSKENTNLRLWDVLGGLANGVAITFPRRCVRSLYDERGGKVQMNWIAMIVVAAVVAGGSSHNTAVFDCSVCGIRPTVPVEAEIVGTYVWGDIEHIVEHGSGRTRILLWMDCPAGYTWGKTKLHQSNRRCYPVRPVFIYLPSANAPVGVLSPNV